MLYLAAALIFATGLAHSILGERYILVRLFKREDLPRLYGDATFTTGTLRFVWHLTTVAWWSLAWLLLVAAGGQPGVADVLKVIGVVALVSGFFPLVFTRGRHLSWVAFFLIAALIFAA
jgi:hypothetical protein